MEDDRHQEASGAGSERAEQARRRLRQDLEELKAEVAAMLAGESEEARPHAGTAEQSAAEEVRRELGRLREDFDRSMGSVRSDVERGFASMRLEMEITEARRLRDEMERMLSGLVRDLRDVADRIAGR